MLKGGYLDVNRGSANSTGWNSITGSFVISKLKNNVRIMGKNVRCDDATNMYGRETYRNVCRKYPKDKTSFRR